MVSTIFGAISDAITNMVSALTSAVNGVVPLFYDASGTTPQLTFLGTILLIAVGVGIAYWAFNLIKSLVKRA